jgi:hypothetical protein
MLNRLTAVFDEGLITTVVATLVATEALGLDLAEIADKATFGLSDMAWDMVPRSMRGPIGTAAQVWAGAYLVGMVVEKGITIPFTEIEIGGIDLPIFETSEGSLF